MCRRILLKLFAPKIQKTTLINLIFGFYSKKTNASFRFELVTALSLDWFDFNEIGDVTLWRLYACDEQYGRPIFGANSAADVYMGETLECLF